MKITIDKEIISDNYSLEFTYDEKDVTEEFTTAIAKYSEPTIEFGGSFTETITDEGGLESTVEVFKLNSNIRKIKSELPFIRVFKTSQYGDNAEKYAEIYANQMKLRIETALTELKEKTDTFSSPDIIINF